MFRRIACNIASQVALTAGVLAAFHSEEIWEVCKGEIKSLTIPSRKFPRHFEFVTDFQNFTEQKDLSY